jgi:hypothetical protein
MGSRRSPRPNGLNRRDSEPDPSADGRQWPTGMPSRDRWVLACGHVTVTEKRSPVFRCGDAPAGEHDRKLKASRTTNLSGHRGCRNFAITRHRIDISQLHRATRFIFTGELYRLHQFSGYCIFWARSQISLAWTFWLARAAKLVLAVCLG